MSDECLLFQKRVQKLKHILTWMKNVFPNIDISTQMINLNKFISIVQDSQSLSTGGSFEWVDSQIVTSLKKGELLSLDHVNFCSSAVLDRLNPVFEPNGSLLISEKGVTSSKECEIVEKHKNFQAFLTIDSKNGELSRAMRNRCVELALFCENYSTDDLRLIVHSNGVKDINLIKVLLSIHNEINSLNEIENLSLSYLSKFSFLVSSYMKMNYSYQDSIYKAGVEVYVYSSHVDPIGYGLKIYKMKLREIIQRLSSSVHFSTRLNLFNSVLNCENMNRIELVVYQTEPLKYINELMDLELLLASLEHVRFKDNQKMLKYYVHILYEISSINDIYLRKLYINNILSGNHAALKISGLFYETIESFKKEIVTKPYLPWNTKMFPRIRDYKSKNSLKEIQMSLTLICHLLFNEVKTTPEKLSQLTVLSYSSAVLSKSINDKFNNTFIKYLFSFLNNIKTVMLSSIKKRQFTINEYLKVSLSFLWSNRMLELASHKIMIGKTINTNVVDKLIVHFKWLEKHLKISPLLNSNEEFDNSYENLLCHCRLVNKPLNLFNKLYAKEMVETSPLHLEEQIAFDTFYTSFNDFTEIAPR